MVPKVRLKLKAKRRAQKEPSHQMDMMHLEDQKVEGFRKVLAEELI